jgi:hypothetical protein
MKITVNRSIIIATITVIAGFLLTANRDYQWLGHSLAGLMTFGFLAWVVFCGSALAGRLRRPPNPGRFKLHRKLGIAVGFAVAATFAYGLLVMLPQGKRLMDTPHGWLGMAIVALSLYQVIPSLTAKGRKLTRVTHRWVGYTLAGLIVLQSALGIFISPPLAPARESAGITLPWLTPPEEAWRPDGVIGPREYYASRVVADGNLEIHYSSDGRYLYVGLKARTTGWVGIGIEAGANAGMQNASIVYGYVENGVAKVYDSFGTSRMAHAPDTELGGTNDIVAFGGQEKDGITIIEFQRAVNTGDRLDLPLVAGVQSIVWAYGATDRPEMHLAQGRIEVDLRAR